MVLYTTSDNEECTTLKNKLKVIFEELNKEGKKEL